MKITRSMQRQLKGSNNTPSFLQWTAHIARSFCCTWHHLHSLVKAPLCCDWKGDLCLFNSWIKRETHETHIFNVSAYEIQLYATTPLCACVKTALYHHMV